MKLLSLLLALSSIQGFAQSTNYTNFVRQTQQGSGVVWDMQNVAATGTAPSVLLLENGGSLFQLWTINQTTGKDYLLDQKLVGAYLPKADVKITSRDSYGQTLRTRIDQPFTVEIQVSDLLSGAGVPVAATKVLLEQHIQNYAEGQSTLEPAVVAANTPLATAFISQNGMTTLKFNASSLTAANPLKASGEEHFIVHALADGAVTQSQIASAKVKVWPIATGTIGGITNGGEYRNVIPTVQLDIKDLYPRSDNYLMVYEGAPGSTGNGRIVWQRIWDSEEPLSLDDTTDELNKLLTKDGTYTLALMSDTIFDNRLLCETVTFSLKRSIEVNAMQVNFSEDSGN